MDERQEEKPNEGPVSKSINTFNNLGSAFRTARDAQSLIKGTRAAAASIRVAAAAASTPVGWIVIVVVAVVILLVFIIAFSQGTDEKDFAFIPPPTTTPSPSTTFIPVRFIDTKSASLEQMFREAADTFEVPVAIMKAIGKRESGVLTYTEDDVSLFSTTGWWAGRKDSEATKSANDPLILRGYGYNTCQYVKCFEGADVRGAMQFELDTWNGVKNALVFPDNHDPDRRNVRDIIFGAARFIKDKALLVGETRPSGWIQTTVRKIAVSYCAGNPNANIKVAACGYTKEGDITYDQEVWNSFLDYLQQENK